MGKAPDGAVLQRAAPSRLGTAPGAGEPLVTAAEETPCFSSPTGIWGSGSHASFQIAGTCLGSSGGEWELGQLLL